jgi:hypothetical protein
MDRIFPYEMVIELLAEDLDAQEMLEISDSKYEIIISKLIRLELIDELHRVTTMGSSISKFPYSIENAVVAYKLAELAKTPSNNKLVLLASICMASIEGSGGNSFFFIPKEERKSKQDFMEMRFSHLKGTSDFETYINIFIEMFNYIETNATHGKHTDKLCAEYARNNSMNNKILKKTRKCFLKLVNLLYNSSYKDRDFVNCVNEFGSIEFDETVMEKVYEIFAGAHSDKVFGNPTFTRKGLKYFKEGDTSSSQYDIDNVRSFCAVRNDRFIALQVIEIRGATSRNCISGIFPIPEKKLEIMVENINDTSDVSTLTNQSTEESESGSESDDEFDITVLRSRFHR